QHVDLADAQRVARRNQLVGPRWNGGGSSDSLDLTLAVHHGLLLSDRRCAPQFGQTARLISKHIGANAEGLHDLVVVWGPVRDTTDRSTNLPQMLQKIPRRIRGIIAQTRARKPARELSRYSVAQHKLPIADLTASTSPSSTCASIRATITALATRSRHRATP